MRVIFLGFNNVLNNKETFERLEKIYFDKHIPEEEYIDYRCLANLKLIVQATDAKIVFTSESIFLPTLEEPIYKAFKDIGLEIYDKIHQEQRDKGIERWLKNNRINSYVIINDERHPKLQKFDENFIGTSYKEGLTIEKAREAIKILLREGLEERVQENIYHTIEIKVDGKETYKIVFLRKGIEEIATTFNLVMSWMDEAELFGTYSFPEVESFYTYQVVRYNNTLYIQGVK